ncbi:MAG TPA: hypothetical protein VF030_09390, partial [Solirubrobacterales bacterium]
MPTSATTSVRCSGVVSSPATKGWRIRSQTVAGPSSVKPPAMKRASIAEWYPCSWPVGKKSASVPSSGVGGTVAPTIASAGISIFAVRIRQARARIS